MPTPPEKRYPVASARELHLNINLLSGGAHHGAWRHPGVDPLAFIHVDRYVESARIAERGKFDAVFLGDVPGIAEDIAYRPQFNGLEPTLVLTAIARATERIGLIATASTSYNEPYNIARRFQALDLISRGRAGWNAVTTATPAVSLNFARTLPDRDERYSRAREFIDVVLELWRTWDPEALLVDVEGGRFIDTDRLPPIAHQGEHFSVLGPFCLPPSPQGHPVIVQAGGSEYGREVAGRTGEAVFASGTDPRNARAYADELRRQVAAHGRDPRRLVILPGLVTTIGGTEQEARRRRHELDQLDLESGGAPNGHLTVVGTPEQVADTIQLWFETGAADGFNLMPDVLTDGLPAFVDQVIPILQQRGLFRTEYRGTTLRDHYGLPLPPHVANIGASATAVTVG
ncbi:NtaA/DmoA family FMN-dependent monooxygenase [Protofrankia symbiont of Coriaria ruscifolia]|uniref:NtaA/DmoA family FMN-dependent monooxygenase n=1 Tax=Protofrankia symbiont of Coriaria ruscifolia TaxID=1306542 RepID=UPI0010410FE2